MTRVLGAATAALFLSCATHGPVPVTVAPVATKSATPPPALVGPRYDDLGCSVYAKDGPAADDVAFRSCLERAVTTPCEQGSSPDLTKLELAVALIDGRGGPVDMTRARNLLAGCFVDVSVQEVLEHAERKEKDPVSALFDSCEAYAQTTIASTDCALEKTMTERGWLRRIELDLAPDARPLFGAASKAFAAYAEKIGEVEYARYDNGTMRSPAMAATILSLTKRRRLRLVAIQTFVPKHPSSEDLADARAEIQRALSAARGAEPEAPEAVDAAAQAWPAYRDAELALYERLFPGSRDAVTVMLGLEHASDLCSTVPP